jgi:hypothetical protein
MDNNTIIYGVGQSILKSFQDATKIIAMSKLKDVGVQFSGNEDIITAGDDPYPFAKFPKDKAIAITATSAVFNLDLLNITQGAVATTGVVTMNGVMEVAIPDDGVVNIIDHATVDAGSVIVQGYTEGADSATLVTGQYFQDATTPTKVNFAVADKAKVVQIVYTYQSGATAQTISVLKDTLSKPFTFIHLFNVFDDNNTIVADGQLIVYKAQAKNAFDFNLQSLTAFAPKIALDALDPKRVDKKLWDFTMSPHL